MPPKRPTPPRKIPTSRAARLGRLGVMAGGVAGNMAAAGLKQISRGRAPSLKSMLLTPANAARLADDLARMRGAAMKLGQLVSMEAGDVLPAELAEILARLRASADPMPPQQLKRVLRDNWGDDWRRSFAHFDVRPIAAASIGQVHRARLPDGCDLAIKVQYPGVARSIDSDVDNLGALLRVSGLLPPGFALEPYLAEAKRQLMQEADYGFEAAQLAAYAQHLGAQSRFELPELRPDWCTDQVLAMSYLPSQPIEVLEDAPQATRDQVMTDLFALMLDEVFTFGLVQSDPNFANYRYNPYTGRVVLLDFGAARAIDPAVVVQCRAVLRAGAGGDMAGADAACTALGLLPATMAAAHRAQILQMLEMVLDATRRPVFDFGTSDLLAQLRARGQALSREKIAPPTPPMDVLYVQRKVAGMVLLATRLRARLPVQALIAAHLDAE